MPGTPRRKIALLTVSAAVALSAGCVTKKKYDALQHDLDQTRSTLEGQVGERDAKIVTLSEALAAEETTRTECEQSVMDLGASIQQLEDELAATRGLKDDAESELAAALASKKNMRASIDEMKAALREASERRLAAERRISEFKEVLRKFKPLIDSGKLEVRVVDGRMVLVLPTDVLFASGRADLSEEGSAAIGEVGTALATFTDRRFQIEGHTDTVPISTKKYPSNWELASARSLGVVNALLAAGVAPAQISAASYGEHRPSGANDTDEGKARNRRIEIVIVPDLSGLPGFDELNELAKPERIPPKSG